MGKYTVVDLFSGVGGLSYGFAHSDAFQIVFANEYDNDIAKAYSLNNPTVQMFNCDIKDLTAEQIKPYISKGIDVLIGGAPCQSYSTLGKRRNDERANLFRQYRRLLSIIQPQIFIFENVTGMLSIDGGKLFEEVKNEFIALGYVVKYKVLNAVEYGVPQIRERVILVGTKGRDTFEYPLPVVKKYVTLADAIGDLPQLKSGESCSKYLCAPQNNFQKFVRDTTDLTEHTAPDSGAHLIEIMQALPDGGNKNDLPAELRPKSGYGNTYAKLWWNKPVPTVTRNFACVSSSRCIHPRDSRALTTREGARLQSFPDSYKFYGSVGKKNLGIGNAVPPLLSVALSKSILEYLRRNENV